MALFIWTGIGILVGMQLGGVKAPNLNEGITSVQQHVQEPRDESIQGNGWGGARKPIVEESSYPEKESNLTLPPLKPSPSDILLPERAKPPADVLADKTAGLLQQLSDQSIRWVVSMFGSITD